MVIHSDHEFIHFSGVAKIKKREHSALAFINQECTWPKLLKKATDAFAHLKNIMDTNKLRFNKVYIHVEYCPN